MCQWVLGIIYRVIATHLVKKAGYTHDTARMGAVTLIQRFGSALNLNIHFHMLFLDGVYVDPPTECFRTAQPEDKLYRNTVLQGRPERKRRSAE